MEKNQSTRRNVVIFTGSLRRKSDFCLGKHISYLGIYKLISTLFQRYEFELTHPDGEAGRLGTDGLFTRQG